MSKMMLKMLADMAGISPEDILKSMDDFRNMATSGIETLESIDERLNNIERHLGISKTNSPVQLTVIEGRELNVGTE